MMDNQKHLQEAQTRAREFEAEREPERLRESYLALDNVVLAEEKDPKTRALVRTDSLRQWLHLLELFDRFFDPGFDIKDVPLSGVQPPPTLGGVLYPPGADPALIDDPKARAQYEKDIAANQAKQERYRMQVHLHRLNEPLRARAEPFIRNSYTSDPADQAELKTAIDAIENPQRKASLSKLLARP